MELRDYLHAARRRWLLIVITTLVLVGLVVAYNATATKVYASKASVFVSTSPSSSSDSAYQSGLYSQQRVASYADIVTGLELAQRVVDDLDLKLTADQLASKVSATAVPNTVLLDITVTDADPQRAQQINTAVLEQLKLMVADIETPPGARRPLVKATVIGPPRLPSAPVSPKPVRNLALGLVLGLLLGFGIAVLREVLDTTVHDVEDVPALADVPVLASLALDADVRAEPLISGLPSHAPRSEAFRVLRTNLQFLDVDAKSRAFVVTSAVPAEGKSTTSVNIAIALSQGDKRVLLVDADLRRSQVAEMLGLERSVGLTTVLLGAIDFDDALQVHEESGLTVLTAGAIPPNPAELLQSNSMRELLLEMKARFDMIIIDAPPLLPVTDAALLAIETDGAIVVVRHSKTTKDQVGGAIERLRNVGAAPLGVIVNMVPQKGGSGGYGYGYGYAPDELEVGSTRVQRREQGRRAKATRKARGERGAHAEAG